MGHENGSVDTIQKNFIKPGCPIVQPTFQFYSEVKKTNIPDFEKVVRVAIQWLENKYPKKFDTSAYELKNYEDHQYGQSIECMNLETPQIWTARLIQPDAPFKGRSAVAGRNWVTEIFISFVDSSIFLYVKILCSSLPYGDCDFTYTRPHVLIDISKVIDFEDVIKITPSVFNVNSQDSYELFLELIENDNRRLPVLVLTEPDKKKFSVPVSDFLLDDVSLARKLQFSAHVVRLYKDFSYRLTDDIGKEWSVYNGAVRIYWPKLSFATARPFDHDLYTATKILFWKDSESFSESAFESYIYNKIFRYNATRDVSDTQILSVEDAKILSNKRINKSQLDMSELIELYDEENRNLLDKIDQLKQEKSEIRAISDRYESERDEYKSELEKTKLTVETLKCYLKRGTGKNFEEVIERPRNYKEIQGWIVKNFSDRLELHNRALKGIKCAKYENIDLVCFVLMLLAQEYRDMRLGVEGAKDQFYEKLKLEGLSFSRSIDESRSGQEGNQYYIEYPSHSGKKVFLEWHIRRGISHDERYCLAVYFYWDVEKEKVIVGWLPSHLDNRLT